MPIGRCSDVARSIIHITSLEEAIVIILLLSSLLHCTTPNNTREYTRTGENKRGQESLEKQGKEEISVASMRRGRERNRKRET